MFAQHIVTSSAESIPATKACGRDSVDMTPFEEARAQLQVWDRSKPHIFRFPEPEFQRLEKPTKVHGGDGPKGPDATCPVISSASRGLDLVKQA